MGAADVAAQHRVSRRAVGNSLKTLTDCSHEGCSQTGSLVVVCGRGRIEFMRGSASKLQAQRHYR